MNSSEVMGTPPRPRPGRTPGHAGCPAALVLSLLWLLGGTAVPAGAGLRLEFNFAESSHGFVAGFADYPTNQSPDFFELTHGWTARPPELGGAPALFISGSNRSDDLWMHWKRRVTGLRPNTEYVLTMELQLASKYATGLFGIGGAPGDSVFVKTGASALEPLAVVSNEGWYRLNLDKGNQAVGGTDLLSRGTIAKPEDGNELHVLLTRSHHGRPQVVRTAADGSLWLIFGTDSGFEGTTSLYYTRLSVWLNPRTEPFLWHDRQPGGIRLIWNEGELQTATNFAGVPAWITLVPPARPFVAPPGPAPVRFWRLRQ